jgi:hypothetical protein
LKQICKRERRILVGEWEEYQKRSSLIDPKKLALRLYCRFEVFSETNELRCGCAFLVERCGIKASILHGVSVWVSQGV